MKNTTAIITGATGNIGSVIAEMASKEFSTLILCGFKNRQKLQKLKKKLESNCTIKIFSSDISVFYSLKGNFGKIFTPQTKINALIHTASVRSDDVLPLAETDTKHWENTLKTNLFGTYYLMKILLPYLRKSDWARVVLLSSSVAKTGLKNGSAYAASKAGVSNLAKTLSLEEGKNGILFNTILPGPVEIDDSHFDKKYNEFRKKYYAKILNQIPLSRLATTHDVAKLALFLASQKNSYITGQEINISGGLI